MNSFPVFLRLQDRPVILLGTGDAAAAKRHLLSRAGARIVSEAEEATLAIVAIDDAADAIAAVSRLKARGILVNATDRPDLCDFTLPAIIDRDPVLIAIGTGGASAGLAKALRQRLEILLPAGLGRLATQLAAARDAIRKRWPEPRARRQSIDAALQPMAQLDPLRDVADEAVEEWIAAGGAHAETMLVEMEIYSDDPDDLTLYEARMLALADVVCHSPDVSSALLNRARADAIRTPCTVPPEQPESGITVYLERIWDELS